jgi:beta-lactamase regulating signal transducer with metallopeptidase domain
MTLPSSPPAASVAAYALNAALEATVVCLVALLAARIIARNDPSLRYAICLGGVVCVLLSPLLPGLLSRTGYGLIRLPLPAVEAEQLPVGSEIPVMRAPRRQHAGIFLRDRPRSPHTTSSWAVWALLCVWAFGAVRGMKRLVRGWEQLARLRRSAVRLDTTLHAETLEPLERALGGGLPPILISGRITGPVAVGIWRGAVVLPQGLAEMLTPEQLRHVLLHECAHVALRHGLGGMAQRLADLLFWPHPLVRLLGREMVVAREEICDNVALQETGAACYARTLLAVAEGASTAPEYASALALLGPGPSLEHRIAGLLDPRRNRMVGVKRWKLWAVTGALAATMAAAATVRVVAQGAQNRDGTSGPRIMIDVVSIIIRDECVDTQRVNQEGETFRCEGNTTVRVTRRGPNAANIARGVNNIVFDVRPTDQRTDTTGPRVRTFVFVPSKSDSVKVGQKATVPGPPQLFEYHSRVAAPPPPVAIFAYSTAATPSDPQANCERLDLDPYDRRLDLSTDPEGYVDTSISDDESLFSEPLGTLEGLISPGAQYPFTVVTRDEQIQLPVNLYGKGPIKKK